MEMVYGVFYKDFDTDELYLSGLFTDLEMARRYILHELIEHFLDDWQMWIVKIPIVRTREDWEEEFGHPFEFSDEYLLKMALEWFEDDEEDKARDFVEITKKVALTLEPREPE